MELDVPGVENGKELGGQITSRQILRMRTNLLNFIKQLHKLVGLSAHNLSFLKLSFVNIDIKENNLEGWFYI
jgi:hypothetical protein